MTGSHKHMLVDVCRVGIDLCRVGIDLCRVGIDIGIGRHT